MFPDPEAMLARYKARGLKICVWINPYIGQASPLFAEGKTHGYLIKRPDGSVWQWDRWQPGQAVVDFTNPDACRWFADHLKRLMAMGVDCFKTDFGERIPVDVAYFDGSDPETMHNYYAYLYNKCVFEAVEAVRGKHDAVVFARSASVGGQKFPVHWGGDCYSDFDSMAESLRAGLSLGLSGFGFWSHDIGGFEFTAEADVYKRWCAFGLLSSHSRLHGSKTYRVPWLYDQEAEAVLGHFVRLKCRLMPYLFAEAVDTTRTGVPLMRAMLLEFPDDIGAETVDRQYMLGSSLLVAPVLSASGEVAVYLPEGRWTHLLSGDVVEGRGWRRETHGFLSLPLYVRPNSLLAFGAVEDRPDYDYAENASFALYQLDDGRTATARIHAADGALVDTMTVTRRGDRLTIASAAGRAWRLRLVGIDRVTAADGARQLPDADGVVLVGAGTVEVAL
jgi:alpha-D-xyloside xylohydrolase